MVRLEKLKVAVLELSPEHLKGIVIAPDL